MASDLYHRYATDSPVNGVDVRRALSELTEDDLSNKSPITPSATNVAVSPSSANEDGAVVVRVRGHGGEWSKTSETALRRAVKSVDGITELVEKDGGYEP
jgi:hypothetical protein